MTFGQRLKQARQAKQMTQGQLAAKAGYVDRRGIWNYEKDQRDPSRATIESLATALEIDPCWLAFGTVQPASPQALPKASPAARKAKSPSVKRGDR